jgi:hypothetical protein
MNDHKQFGFYVIKTVVRADDEVDAPRWTVLLPHQCDAWCIAGDDYDGGVTHAEAVERLRRFIVEAQAALAALQDGREVAP